jgi:hypothetical protein
MSLPGLDELSADEQQMLEETDRFARAELYPPAPRMDRDEWRARRPAGADERPLSGGR